ncbi:hypothetical protein B5X24_HaOG202943 [Helicoverpa armigera]|uniref:Uncharacterized protein n=1 Tax=Helicoverpa armigera TaxID=29058 RepID=A0A2W1BRW9_HELAM|nr:hypothetical protein B5X24_HaOG202943 [Helicoverpa armigera]
MYKNTTSALRARSAHHHAPTRSVGTFARLTVTGRRRAHYADAPAPPNGDSRADSTDTNNIRMFVHQSRAGMRCVAFSSFTILYFEDYIGTYVPTDQLHFRKCLTVVAVTQSYVEMSLAKVGT